MNDTQARETMLDEIEVGNITRHIEWLTTNTPNRISSGTNVQKAAAYIVNYLDKLGFEVENEEFYTYNSTPFYSKLELLEPERLAFDSLPCCHIRSTAREGEIFDLVYLTTEDYRDLGNKDIAGKMILVEMSYAPPVPEKARLLHESGAAGMVCMNWGNDEAVICNRALKAIWGNPTVESFAKIPDIVGIGVTRSTGLTLKDLCEKHGSVKIKAAAIADRQWQQVVQPKAILRGNGKSEQFLLVSSHLDAWEPGVTCNATGNALTLELCRVLSNHRAELNRDIWVTFWNGHEIAEAAGSTWFVDTHWDELYKKCVCYMHIDSPGLKDATLFEIKSSDELYDFAQRNAEKTDDIEIRMMELKKIGDQSFMGIGVPSVTQRMSYTEAFMRENNGATLGWWNHTKEDDLEKYDPRIIKHDAHITLSFLYHLDRAEILPYEFAEKFKKIQNRMENIRTRYGGKIDFSDLMQNLSEAEKAVAKIQAMGMNLSGAKQKDDYNRFLLEMTRALTNIFQTYADKYDQDSYGYSKLSEPVPLLADLKKLETLPESSLAFGLLKTGLIRNKNRINDGLNHVISTAKLYERLLTKR